MNKEIKEITQVHADYDHQLWIFYIDKNGERHEYVDIDEESLTDYITNLQKENQKLNKIIDELERWLKEDEEKAENNWEMGRCFNMFDILNKLTELKKEVE